MNKEKYKVDNFLSMTWLRPENVVWDSMASYLIGNELLQNGNILEIGIGNGYFSFITLGGVFKKEFDWYYNVEADLKKFKDNEDIYNTYKFKNLKNYIEKPAKKKIMLAIDHKENLIAQAKDLGIVENSLVLDANKPFNFMQYDIDIVYSNILYWLNDPISVLKNIDKNLKKGSKVVLVFPNNNFYKYAKSYKKHNNIWKLLNRGRADCMMWNMDIIDFEKNIKKETNFKIEKFQTYLSKLTLEIWDIGLRPLSIPLIKMANFLDKQKRFEIKQEWIEILEPYVLYILENEIKNGSKNGGFNFVVLHK